MIYGRIPRILAMLVVICLVLLPASAALAGPQSSADRSDSTYISIENPHLWFAILWTHVKLALQPTTATISPAPSGTLTTTVISPTPAPDPTPLPLGPTGGGGCVTCSGGGGGGGGGGDTGGGSDPDGGKGG